MKISKEEVIEILNNSRNLTLTGEVANWDSRYKALICKNLIGKGIHLDYFNISEFYKYKSNILIIDFYRFNQHRIYYVISYDNNCK